ncbi:MAG: LptF/LptG family permease [Chitinophagaceae bacterium]|jgi:lipopolysaccharide export system permease protein|nr:LptF/LptG family permease [Chitinophagaceae bacterium]
MKLIDKYIIKKFLTTFLFTIALFIVISIVIDIGEKTDDFIKSQLGVWRIFTDYYLSFIPYIAALLFPLFVYISVIFFTSKMAGRSEMIAILAAGTSFNRILRPYLFTGIFLATVLFFADAFVVPRAEVKRTGFVAKYVDGNSSYNALVRKAQNLYFRVDSFSYLGIRNYDTNSKNGGPVFLYRIKNDMVDYNMRAASIRWDTAVKKWQLQNVLERYIKGIKESTYVTPSITLTFNGNLKPNDLRSDDYAKEKMTTPELQHSIDMQTQRGGENINELKIEKFHRIATPFSVIILTMIGAILAIRKVRGGSGVHLAIGAVSAATFIIMDRFSTIFSTKGNFPPLVAAWLPNVVFALVAIYFYRKAPK